MFFDGYGYRRTSFEQTYRCYPASFIDKPQIENGDKIIMPPSALDRLASLHIDYPMLFEVRNAATERVSHCGVLEFIAEEGMIYMPYWMMENLLLQEGDIVRVKNATLPKGTYVKLQPHTMDFLDISNPKAILETTLRNFSCLTTGDSIMVAYNNKKYYIDIIEAKPSNAITIIETDCEVDFAPPLDYKEPEKPASSLPSSKAPIEVDKKMSTTFSGDETAPFFGFLGAAAALVFSCMGAAYGTAKSDVGVVSMGVMRPELVMKSIVPVVMAGVLGIYGLIILARELTPRPSLITFLMDTHIFRLGLLVVLLDFLLEWQLELLVMPELVMMRMIKMKLMEMGLSGLLRAAWTAGIFPILIASIPSSRLNSFREIISGFAKRGKILQSSSTRFTVPQKFFCHFYVVGVLWTTLLLVVTWCYAYIMTPVISEPMLYSSIPSYLTGSSDTFAFKFYSKTTKHRYKVWKSVFLLLLLEAQVLRRLFETIYIFKYSPSARMHIFGYVTGLYFYTAAPLSLCCTFAPELFNFATKWIEEFIVKGKDRMTNTEFDEWGFIVPLISQRWYTWIGAGIFFWGWIHQRRCHAILGSLRDNKIQAEAYVVPGGDWFNHVSSPHYLAEIVIYGGLLVASGCTDLTIWLLFAFVVANLVFAAAETHRWYLRKFEDYPDHRLAIIPFVY